MAYRKIKKTKLLYSLGLIAFGIAAMASSESKSFLRDDDFQEGVRQGINNQFLSQEETETQNIDSILVNETLDLVMIDNEQ